MGISFKPLCGREPFDAGKSWRAVVLPLLQLRDVPQIDLKPGDLCPGFEAIDDLVPWKSADVIGKKFVVIYFYPGDFTLRLHHPGPEVFRDDMNKLTEKGIVVIGVSGDAVRTHQLFKNAQQLNFTLLADEDGSLARKFRVPVGKGGEVKTKDAEGKPLAISREVTIAARVCCVIDEDGKIAVQKLQSHTIARPVSRSLS